MTWEALLNLEEWKRSLYEYKDICNYGLMHTTIYKLQVMNNVCSIVTKFEFQFDSIRKKKINCLKFNTKNIWEYTSYKYSNILFFSKFYILKSWFYIQKWRHCMFKRNSGHQIVCTNHTKKELWNLWIQTELQLQPHIFY